MKRGTLVLAALALLLGDVVQANASLIYETEPNDTLGTAQNIDGNYSLDNNPAITNSTTVPHVTVLGTGNYTYDWYSFTVTQNGSSVTLDIDYTTNLDSVLRLYTSGGSFVTGSDDNGYDYGSQPGQSTAYYFDSRLTTVLNAGTYAVEVSRYPQITITPSQSYTLHISVENQSTAAVPEPSSLALFGLATTCAAGYGGWRRRKKAVAA